jgi:hypothetical protein
MNTYAHLIFINTSERLTWFNLEIYEVGYQERLAVDRNVTSY